MKASVTNFWKIVKTKNVEIQEIKERKYKIQEIWDEYEQIQSAIELIKGIDINKQNMYREEFEASFFGAIGTAKKLIDAPSEKGSNSHLEKILH